MDKRRKAVDRVSGKSSAITTLLQATAKSVRSLSLRNHLALATLGTSCGNGNLLSDLIRVPYVTWYLREAGFGAAGHAFFLEAEAALERSTARATSDNAWQICETDKAVLKRLLALHERNS